MEMLESEEEASEVCCVERREEEQGSREGSGGCNKYKGKQKGKQKGKERNLVFAHFLTNAAEK
jgi:hypothetical protein